MPERAALRPFIREALIFGIGRQASAAAALVLVPLLTRKLGPYGMGLADVCWRAVTCGIIVGNLGIDTANLIVFNQLEPAERGRTLTASLIFRAVATAAALGLLALLASRPGFLARVGIPEGAPLQAATAAGLAFVLSQQVADLLRLARRKWAFAGLNIATTAINIVAMIVLVVVLERGVVGYWTAFALGHLLVFPVALWLARDLLGPPDPHALRRLFAIGLPGVGASLADWALASLDRYALIIVASLNQVGVLSVATQLASAVALIGSAFQIAWGPYALAIQREEHAPAAYARIGRLLVLALSGVALVLALFAEEILAVFTTREFASGGPVVACLVFAPIFMSLYYLFSVGLLITERTFSASVAVGLALAVNVVGVFALVPRFGAVGAAIATVAARLVQAVATYAFAQRAQPIAFDVGRMSLGIVLTAAGIIGGRFLPSIAGRAALFGVTAVALVAVLAREEVELVTIRGRRSS